MCHLSSLSDLPSIACTEKLTKLFFGWLKYWTSHLVTWGSPALGHQQPSSGSCNDDYCQNRNSEQCGQCDNGCRRWRNWIWWHRGWWSTRPSVELNIFIWYNILPTWSVLTPNNVLPFHNGSYIRKCCMDCTILQLHWRLHTAGGKIISFLSFSQLEHCLYNTGTIRVWSIVLIVASIFSTCDIGKGMSKFLLLLLCCNIRCNAQQDQSSAAGQAAVQHFLKTQTVMLKQYNLVLRV